MIIENVEVKNYKSLRDFTSPKFMDINLIFGVNNSGKSNFLDFLEMFFSSKKEATRERVMQDDEEIVRLNVEEEKPFYQGQIYDIPYIFADNNKENDIEFTVKLSEKNENIPESDLLSASGLIASSTGVDSTVFIMEGNYSGFYRDDLKISLEKVKMNNKVIFTLKGSTPKYFEGFENEDLVGNESLFLKLLDNYNDSVLLIDSNRYFGQDSLSGDELTPGNFKDWLFKKYLDVDTYQDYRDLVNFISSLSISEQISKKLDESLESYPFTNKNIEFGKIGDELELMLDNKFGRLPLSNFGTGVQQILYIFSKIYSSKDKKVVAIEELELNLSKEYQDLVINNIKEMVDKGIIDQVFFTSHSKWLKRNDYNNYKVTIDGKGSTSMKKVELPPGEARERQREKK